ncbi:MAG TPA: hypothetical protein VK773_06715 [Acidimicrobiales bacterium]|jgi:hypothetical protein|nr:hypothetical protein [Acidimicrobiales bacterium]
MTLHDTHTRDAAPADAEPVRPPTPGGFSIRPAMVVLGLAVVILATFVTLGIVSSQTPAPVKTSGAPSAVPGSSLRGEPAADALKPIVGSGEPPSNIINAVTVPVGSVRTSHQNNAAGAGQYDAQVTLRSTDSQGALLAFFASSMEQQGWQVFDKGAAANDPGALEVLGKLAGTDGYYWEMGATIPPTSFGHGAPPSGATDFTIRLLQQNDDQS